MKSLIDIHGLLTFGRHRGKRPDQVPPQWLAWASENIEGFAATLRQLEAIKNRPKPTGRTYILRKRK